MVRVLFFILLSSFAFADLQYLAKSIVTQTVFENVTNAFSRDTTTTNSNDDAVDENVPIGFSFPFNGNTYTTVNIDTNGWLSFANITSQYINKALAHNDISIYPYWDDLNPQRGGTVKYGTLGSGDTQHFIIEWKVVPHYPNNGSYSLQVVLYKNGDIRFRYDNSSDVDGSSATIGVQESTTNYDEHSFNNANTFDASKDILYRKKRAILSMVKNSCVIFDSINATLNPKRIPGATIRYAIEVKNEGSSVASDVKVSDSVGENFNETTITNLQIQSGACDCLGIASASDNGANGTSDGINPVVLDFGEVLGGSVSAPTKECGYFEVNIK